MLFEIIMLALYSIFGVIVILGFMASFSKILAVITLSNIFNITVGIYICCKFTGLSCCCKCCGKADTAKERGNCISGFTAMTIRCVVNLIFYIAVTIAYFTILGDEENGYNGICYIAELVVSLILILWWRNSCNRWADQKK